MNEGLWRKNGKDLFISLCKMPFFAEDEATAALERPELAMGYKLCSKDIDSTMVPNRGPSDQSGKSCE
jgi:hypothetical protein